ncbi:phosphatase 2C-like domain-containing protein [Crepidotus variabilis]|uniref:Phosphatase 2C-like domain-containing protein n=1 Tax=Crepidotus variabilis TaxID=179855 RepID=A0A9P6EI33_9AGAR|nr:phosphatase 2C-like domain-containing protein [Crepidotus variabilis]
MATRKVTDMGWGQADALWFYTALPEPMLSSELERLAFATSFTDTDVVSFQPCPNPEHSSQDRYVIRDWALPGGNWGFRAIFDGHAGHETADYTASTLPDIIQEKLASVLEKNSEPSPAIIAETLSKAISDFDDSIGEALLKLFPDKLALLDMPDEDVKSIINDGGPNAATVLHCMRGTTVLISVTDPSRKNLWVASLGDCAAILGTKNENGSWKSTILSSSHNGENPLEAEKVKKAHPGEPECVLEDRVLGAIAVTRAVGDYYFKIPALYTHRVFLNAEPGFQSPEKVRSFISRNLTPPYMSGVPDVQHIDLSKSKESETFLILCTDGLIDCYDDHRLRLAEYLGPLWVKIVGRQSGDASKNLALTLLRDALGGDDLDKVSRNITVEMTFRWMDDTTIVVHRLH